jgi:hypothetical protein
MSKHRFTPEALAQTITRDCSSVNAQNTKGHRFGICPACTRVQRLGSSGALVRHGWQAKNVRHGQSTGFHIGGHGSLAPIGTEAGNFHAQAFARSHRKTADHMEAQDAPTEDDAILAHIQDINASRDKSWLARGRYGVRPVPFKTLDEVKAWKSWSMYSGWFSPASLASQASRMLRDREANIADHRAHAEILEALVVLNPA